MSWQEYSAKNQTVADWLPWGGLTAPSVLENKDGSFLGVIKYKPLSENTKIEIPEMQNGWAFWFEEQYLKTYADSFFVICWNPIIRKDGIINALNGKTFSRNKARRIFKDALSDFTAKLSSITDCELLEYQELIDFLTFSLSMGESYVEMPDIPLYLDALLSNDIPWSIDDKNDIGIGDKWFVAVSVPASIQDEELDFIISEFKEYPIRHVRRLLLFDKESAKDMMEAYTTAWCKGRKSIKNLMLNDIITDLSGYYTDTLILLADKKERELVEKNLSDLLSDLELSFRIEEYNRKDVWWGTLPGVFRANVMPPITGFSGLYDLLSHKSVKKIVIGDDNYVSLESV
ncbi:MAG: hypothetical protein IKN12_02725 [Selenomonadaceae bacterium]|nr:hypothetical protein [Selenomonadaceae bacterium]